jgi:FkbM family methyltransferase
MTARWMKLFLRLGRAPGIFRCARACAQWAPLSLAYIGLRPLRYPYLVLFRDGDRIRLDTFFDLTTFWSTFFCPAYPVQPNDAVIMDAGANIGTFTLYAARTAPAARIWAIEPFDTTFQRLTETVVSNRLSDRVTCLQCALGDQEGEARMPTSDQPSQFRRLVTGVGEATIPVKVTSIEAIFRAQEIDRVDLLKLDIEGGEYPSILCSPPNVLRRIRRICMEYHPMFADELCSKEPLFAHLARAGMVCTLDVPNSDGYGIAHFQLRADI